MKIYVAIDDTDNIDQGSTGASANAIIKHIETKGWGKCRGLTRHQLLIHKDIPYTSHNSAMCFTADIEARKLAELIKETGCFLKKESAPGSDPGLCVAVREAIAAPRELMDFGQAAKARIITKKEAFSLAETLGVHLSEHGGTGIGVIGALAGVGLRMTDNDGRFQGRFSLKSYGETLSVAKTKRLAPVDVVQTRAGEILGETERVCTSDFTKTVLLNGKRTLLVCEDAGQLGWQPCSRGQLKDY